MMTEPFMNAKTHSSSGSSVQQNESNIHRFTHKAMATIFELVFTDNSQADAQWLSDEAFHDIDQLEQKLSYFIPHSEVAQFNQAGISPLRLSPETFECISLAKQFAIESYGAFDPMVGTKLRDRTPWDSEEETPRGGLPIENIDNPIYGDIELIQLHEESLQIIKLNEDVKIDLGGIGKGYAIDHIRSYLEEMGQIEQAMINAGQSTMFAMGQPENEQGWLMRFLDPRNEVDLLGTCKIKDLAISSSSCVEQDHIINPKTGKSSSNWLGSWVISPSAAQADALSTAFTVMELDEIVSFCNKNQNIATVLLSSKNNKLEITTLGPLSDYSCQWTLDAINMN